jgi:RNA polymerase sigma-70 factor (ECF subfamily)
MRGDGGIPPGGPGEPDDALLARMAAGDRDAWGTLVARHLPAIVRYAGTMLGNGAHAEDVAQETFLRLMAKAPGWRPGGPTVRAWLTRVAANLCMDHRRARWLEPLEAAANLADARNHTALETDLDMARSVRAALARLPERQLAAVVLVHYQGFSGAEAAGVLDISVAALESLLARARRALRRDLADLAPDQLGDV